MTLSLRTDRRLIRAGARSTRFVVVDYAAPEAPRRDERAPVNIALVLDRSGSMGDARKFDLARQAVEQALRMLRPEDRFALVVYDNQIDVLAPAAPATHAAVGRAIDALAAIAPRGGTNLSGGWLRGCEQIAEQAAGDAISRCLLLTDGLANDGITDRNALAVHAMELRRRGVATTTFGVGADFDERLLRDMAHEGGGNFYFIEGAVQIPQLLTSELGEALEVVVRDAALEVALPPGADAEPLSRFRYTHAVGDNELRVELGDLVSAQEVRAVLRVTFARGEPGAEAAVQLSLVGRGASSSADSGEIGWTYATHAANDAQPRDAEVDFAVAELYAARARADATEANRVGDLRRARQVLERTAQRIRSYAGTDVRIQGIALSLGADVPRFAEHAMPAMALKQEFFQADAAQRFRDREGRARRQGPRA